MLIEWREKKTSCFPSSVIPSSFIIPAATLRSGNCTSRAAWQHLAVHTPCLHLILFIKCQPLNFIRCMTLSNPICSHCRDFQLLHSLARSCLRSVYFAVLEVASIISHSTSRSACVYCVTSARALAANCETTIKARRERLHAAAAVNSACVALMTLPLKTLRISA